MFYKSVLLASALCTFAVAHIAVSDKGPVNVKLPRRSNLARSNSSFDLEQVIALKNKTVAKYQQNERNRKINAQRKTSVSALLDENTAEIKITPSHNRSTIHARQIANEPIIFDSSSVFWDGYVWMGSPHQNVIISIDTASSDLWVVSSNCNAPACELVPKYNVSQSSSAQELGGNFTTPLGVLTISGPLVEDTVVMAGIPVFRQQFATIDQVPDDVGGTILDGVFGLGLPKLASSGQSPWFLNAMNQGAVANGEFALKLADEDSVLTLGGTDQSKYNKPIEFHKVDQDTGYWQILDASIFLGSQEIISGAMTIIDSATPWIIGPQSAVAKIYSQIPEFQLVGSGAYIGPCSTNISISFSWSNGRKWTMPSADFMLEPSSTDCVGAIMGEDNSTVDGQDVWMLGHSFLQSVYTVFQVMNMDVGFAELK